MYGGLFKREKSVDSGEDFDKRLFNYNAYQRNANKRADGLETAELYQMLKRPMMSPIMYNRPRTFVAEK